MRSYKTGMAAVLAVLCFNARAEVDLSRIEITAGPFTAVQAANTVTFDGVIPSDIYYSSTDIVSGTVPGEYVAPADDDTYYLRTVNDATVITFDEGKGVSYFGVYLGSTDYENTLTIYSSDGTALAFGEGQLQALISTGGDQASFYLNLYATTGTAFTKIVFSSIITPMETDNHAYILADVPEPETYAMLLGGLALVGAIGRRRRS